MAATRHRSVAGAAAHPVRKSTTVRGSAGSAVATVAAHQSVNSAQSAAKVRRVRADNTLADSSVTLTVLVSSLIGQRPRRVTAFPTSGACSRA